MMRWLYGAGLSAIAATIVSDVWVDPNYEWLANVALIAVAALTTAFALLYATRSRWWVNRVGKVYLAKSLILALVLIQAVVSVWWQDDYPGRQVIRFAIYSAGAIAYVSMLIALRREQRRDRREQRNQQRRERNGGRL